MRDDDLAALNGTTLHNLEVTLDLHTRERVPVTKYTAFSWSVSRHSLFERCKRAYYLNYYAARRVIEARDRSISAVWWLKQVTTLRTWVGQVVHRIAAEAVRALRDGQELRRDDLIQMADRIYREGLEASRRGIKHEGEWRVLFEHIYPNDPFSIDRDEAHTAVRDLTNALLDSEAYDFLRSLPPSEAGAPGAIREVDEPFQSFELLDVPELGQVRVFAIPDVLAVEGESVHIIDWKTGSTEHAQIRHQAGIYQLYAHQAYDVPEEAITFRLADLGGAGESVEVLEGVPSIAEAEAFARQSIYNMVARLEDAGHNTATIKNYPMTDDLSHCQWCGFKRACWRHEAIHD